MGLNSHQNLRLTPLSPRRRLTAGMVLVGGMALARWSDGRLRRFRALCTLLPPRVLSGFGLTYQPPAAL